MSFDVFPAYPKFFNADFLEEVYGQQHDVTVYCPQVGLCITLLCSVAQVKHHPSVSFLFAGGQGRQICWLVAECIVTLCCDEEIR